MLKSIKEFYSDYYQESADDIINRVKSEKSGSKYNSKGVIVKGIDNLIKILMALGNEKLERGGYYSDYYSEDSKKSNLSHLLKKSQPDKDDTSKLFAKKIKGSKISQQRLIEVAMYAPRWTPLIQEYLGWEGLESACYYFHAHISDVSKNKES